MMPSAVQTNYSLALGFTCFVTYIYKSQWKIEAEIATPYSVLC